jgi:hypothetical protein
MPKAPRGDRIEIEFSSSTVPVEALHFVDNKRKVEIP